MLYNNFHLISDISCSVVRNDGQLGTQYTKFKPDG
jgi:hypothetical protein